MEMLIVSAFYAKKIFRQLVITPPTVLDRIWRIILMLKQQNFEFRRTNIKIRHYFFRESHKMPCGERCFPWPTTQSNKYGKLQNCEGNWFGLAGFKTGEYRDLLYWTKKIFKFY
jgi:hypothetical protein